MVRRSIARAQDRTKVHTLRAVRVMVAMRLIRREILAPAGSNQSRTKITVAGSLTAARAQSCGGMDRCKGETPEGSSGAATVGASMEPANVSSVRPHKLKIDISNAPSGMELAAASWRGKGHRPMAGRTMKEAQSGQVNCKCGSRTQANEGGPVPDWFGEKCIEADCPLRSAKG